MSDEVDEWYDDKSPNYSDDVVDYGGYEVHYILYGYRLDSLRNLFPIFVVADNGGDYRNAEEAVISLLEDGTDGQGKEWCISAPGTYDLPREDTEEKKCQIRFEYLTPSTDPKHVDDGSRPDARRIFRDLIDAIQEERNLYYNSVKTQDIKHARFWIKYIREPRILLPFPTERPNGPNYENHRNTLIPCYIVTDSTTMRENTRLISVQWAYPVL